MGGLLSQLVGIKAQREQQAFNDQMGIYKTVFKQALDNPDSVEPGTLEAAANAIGTLADSQLGGAGAGGGKGKGKGGGGIGDLFKGLLTMGAYNIYKHAGQQRERTADAMEQARAGMPKQILRSPEERAEIKARMANIDFKAKLRQDLQKAEALQKQKDRITNQNNYELAAKAADAQNLVGDQWLKYVNDYMAGVKPDEGAKESSTEKTELAGPKGEQLELYRDPRTGKFYDDENKPVDMAALKLQGYKRKEPSETTLVRQYQDALRDSKSDDPVQREAGQRALKSLDAKEKGINLTNIIKGETAASNAVISPSAKMTDEELGALAEKAIISNGADPSFGLSARNPLRERYQKIKARILIRQGVRESLGQAADFRAQQATLTKLTELQGTMRGALAGTNLEIDRLKKLAAAIPRSRFAKYNQLSQFLNANLSDDPDLARFREALVAARSRYSNMLASLRSAGTATNQVRTETADDVINRFMPSGAMDAAADEMKVGIQNVMDGMNTAVDETRMQLRGGPSAPTPIDPDVEKKLKDIWNR